MKPKILLDITILGHGFDIQSARRGVERTVENLFDGLLKSDACDVTFTATSSLAGTYDFLKTRGIDPEQRLKFWPKQLSSSRWARQFRQKVHHTLEDRSLPARSLRKVRALAAGWLEKGSVDLKEYFLADADIYHTPHTNYPLLPFPPAVRKHPTIRKFVTIHDLMTVSHPEIFGMTIRPYFQQMLECLSETTFAFCASESVRADILELTPLRPERIFLAPLAAERELFHPVAPAETRAALEELGIPNRPYFLALSVAELHKNFGHLIQCLVELVRAKELPDHNLVIVGRNAARHPLLTGLLAGQPELAKRILTPGFVPDEKLAALYSGATAFLFPSLAEGFGLPPLEAMQCGAPVISSNTTSMPEVIGDAGILLPPSDVDGWCQAMLNLAHEENLRAELRGKSLARAELFSWERHVAAVEGGYRAAMAI